MSRLPFQLVAVLLFGAMVVAGTGVTHLWLAAAAPAPAAGCHHGGVPTNPSPADYRCCVTGHHAALLNRIFSQRPVLLAVKLSDVSLTLANASESNAVPGDSVGSGGPPLVLNLRI